MSRGKHALARRARSRRSFSTVVHAAGLWANERHSDDMMSSTSHAGAAPSCVIARAYCSSHFFKEITPRWQVRSSLQRLCERAPFLSSSCDRRAASALRPVPPGFILGCVGFVHFHWAVQDPFAFHRRYRKRSLFHGDTGSVSQKIKILHFHFFFMFPAEPMSTNNFHFLGKRIL